MNLLHVWLAPSNMDLAVHYWYQLNGNILPHRLCDGALGMKEPDAALKEYICLTCRDTYKTDLLHGHQAFRLTASSPSQEETDTKQVASFPSTVIRSFGRADQTNHGERKEMPKISLPKFIEFCEAPTQKKVGVVNGRGFNYYGPLMTLLRRTHWTTGLIDTFRTELPAFLEDQNTATKRENLRLVGEAYIEYWLERAAAHFSVGQYEVNLGGLAIRIGPVVGMVNMDGDYQFLKLWYKQGSPSSLARQIIGYFMDEVKEDSSWHSGVWDIRKKNVPLPMQISGNFRGELEDQATMYLDYLRQP